MKKALVLIGAAGYNRGSEILLTGILELLKKTERYQTDITAFAIREEWANENDCLFNCFIPRETPYSCFWYKVCNNLGMRMVKWFGYRNLPVWFFRQGICRKFTDYDLLVFVGADNFDYQTSNPNELNALISLSKKSVNSKKILFDCSIADTHINRFFLKNLKQINLVTTRDSISYENISRYFRNVVQHADPAFSVKAKKIAGFEEGQDYIGINISPLVQNINDKVYINIINLVKWILKNTKSNILLIPHVMQKQDYYVLEKIKCAFKEEKRVILIEDDKYSAQELKYIISLCQIFVGARTHAMIAAYSSCVPALGIGYSVKSEGIAKDIMGEKYYCIQAEEIQTEMDILQLFLELLRHENEVREHLRFIMPDYINTLAEIGDLL